MKFLILFLLFVLGCSKEKPIESVPPSGLAGSAKIASHQVYTGSVAEIIKRDQFVYVRLDQNWFALVGASLQVGQKVKIEEQAVFEDFHSKTLGRVFSKIIFGKLLEPKQANDPTPIEPH